MKRICILILISCQLIMAQQVQFFRTYGYGIYDSGEGVLQTNDSGYVVGGITSQTGSNGTDMLIYKTDSLGVLQWYKPIGQNNCIDGARSIASGRSKSEFLLAGYQNNYDTSGYNFYVIKTDLNGDTIWTKTYGGSDWDMAYSVDTLQDSTYVIAGETFSFGNGNSDMYVIRIDGNGDTIWTRTFGGINDDYAHYVFTDRHNNIMVVGSTYSFGAGGSDVYLVYLNSSGDTIWTKTHGSVADEFGYGGDTFLNVGGYLSFALAYTQYNPVSDAQETRFFRVDSADGALVYDIYFWYENQDEILDHPRMRFDDKGKYYLTGDIRYSEDGETDVYLHRTDYGIAFSTSHADIIVPEFEYPKDIRKCYDRGLVVTGSTTSYGPGPTSSFLLKTDTILLAPNVPVVAVGEYEALEFSVYPNPVTNQLVYINAILPIEEVRLFDLNGKVIQIVKGNQATAQSFVVNQISSGIYIIEVISTKGSGRKKLIIQ